jgi:hypothetical protein
LWNKIRNTRAAADLLPMTGTYLGMLPGTYLGMVFWSHCVSFHVLAVIDAPE